MADLVGARALAEFFETVTVVERDVLEELSHRRGANSKPSQPIRIRTVRRSCRRCDGAWRADTGDAGTAGSYPARPNSEVSLGITRNRVGAPTLDALGPSYDF